MRVDQEASRAMYDLADMVEDKNTSNLTKLSRDTSAMDIECGDSPTPIESGRESEKVRVVRRREKYHRKYSHESFTRSPSMEFTRKEGKHLSLHSPRGPSLTLFGADNHRRVTISTNEIESDQELDEMHKEDTNQRTVSLYAISPPVYPI